MIFYIIYIFYSLDFKYVLISYLNTRPFEKQLFIYFSYNILYCNLYYNIADKVTLGKYH